MGGPCQTTENESVFLLAGGRTRRADCGALGVLTLSGRRAGDVARRGHVRGTHGHGVPVTPVCDHRGPDSHHAPAFGRQRVGLLSPESGRRGHTETYDGAAGVMDRRKASTARAAARSVERWSRNEKLRRRPGGSPPTQSRNFNAVSRSAEYTATVAGCRATTRAR